jgi:hypothetical protein
MGRLSAAMKPLLQPTAGGGPGVRPTKILKLGFPTAAGGPLYFAGSGHYAPAASILPNVTRWDPIPIGAAEQPGGMRTPEVRVVIADKEPPPLRAILEGAVDVSNSPSGIYWTVPGLAEFDVNGVLQWTPLSVGILDSFAYDGLEVEVTLKPDSHALDYDDVPRTKLTRGDWPLIHAIAQNTYAPIVYGIHDAVSLSGKGMIDCPNVRFDATAGYYYVVSLGWIKSVDRLYLNGTLKTFTTQWDKAFVVAGGKRYTVVFLIGITPLPTDVIQVDCKGLTVNADGTGALITGGADVLKHALVNFGFGDWQAPVAGLTGYLPDTGAPLDVVEFGSAAVWGNQFGWESAWRIGATAQAGLGNDVLNSWRNSFPSMRAWWTERGQIACGALRHHDDRAGLYPSDPWLREENLIGKPEDAFVPRDDATQLMSRVSGSYLYGEADRKYWGALEVQDPTLARRGQQSYSLPFSARRVL